MSSSPSPSHRNPLALLSKLKRQLSKSPVTHQQPIEHQYLPIPTVSFPESLRSPSAYSCSNHSSSGSSFVFIDHNEEPAPVAVDEYRPFLPLIIQHERRLAAVTTPPRTPRPRIPPPNEPPSPTSTASSKSPVTPIFMSSFLGTEEEDIMTLSNSDVGSISEYSLPGSLSAYMEETRTIRSHTWGRKSTCSSSDSESRRGRARGLFVHTPPSCARRYPSYKSFPPAPISPPPSCPLPDPPVSIRPRAAVRHLPVSDGELASSPRLGTFQNAGNRARAGSVGASPPPSMPIQSPVLGLSPAICLVTRKKSSASILSELEIPSVYNEPATSSNKDYINDDLFATPTSTSPSPSTNISLSPPTTPIPKQYGIGRKVLRGSGCDFRCSFSDSGTASSSKRSSKRMSTKRESSGIESRSFVPESTLDPKLADGIVGDRETPVEVLTTSTPTQSKSPTPASRRRVQSDDTSPSINTTSRRTTHYEKPRVNPEWTLFLGIPRNAAPPLPVHVSTDLPRSGSPNAVVPKLASTIAAPPTTEKIQRYTFLPTHLPPPVTTRSRTNSDSALLAGATASGSTNTEHGDGKVKLKTKTKRENSGEDWTLSLPLAASPTLPITPSAMSKYLKVSSGSVQVVVAEESERCVGVDANTGLVITVEDVDRRQMQQRAEDEKRDEEGEEDQDLGPLIFRVPRIVRSCSSSPPPSTYDNIHGRIRKKSMKWMGASSTPNLRSVQRFSSSTLEEEVMCMLLGDNNDEVLEEDYDNESSKKSTEDLATAMMLAQKRMATLDEDLARFNALLRNGNGNGCRLTSTVIEASLTMAKTKTVTLDSQPSPIAPISTSSKKSTVASSSQTLPVLKPVLKHAKSCEPFVESSNSNGHPFPPPPPPVLRFPSSTARGDLSFFDQLGGGSGGEDGLEPSRSSLRLTRSAEWVLGAESNTFSTWSMSTSPRGSPPPPPQRMARSSTCSISLLPFAHTKYAPPSSLSLKSKGSGRESRISSIRAASMGSLRSITPTPVETSFDATKSQKEKQQESHHYRKRGPPTHLPRLHTNSSSISISTSPASPPQRHSKNDNKRPISPSCPPSPIPSESSSALPTPLASAFPLPPTSPGMSGFVQKLKEFECAREKQQPCQSYKPPPTASSVNSLDSNASSTATVIPSSDQKMRMRRVVVAGGSGSGVMEDDEDSMCSGTYYSARSSFSEQA